MQSAVGHAAVMTRRLSQGKASASASASVRPKQHALQKLGGFFGACFHTAPARRKSSGVAATSRVQPVLAAAGPSQDSTDLADYVSQGYVASTMGLSKQAISADIALWKQLGDRLARQLKLDPASLNESQRSRIYQYYLPTYFWVKKELAAHRAKYAAKGEEPPAFVVGISAPQGCGKTTLVSQLQELLIGDGCPTASVSLDDYYLTGAEQDALAAKYPDNGLLKFRGNAGSHDLQLAKANLEELKGCNVAGKKVQVPRYDKSLREGRGDRAAKETWPALDGPLQVVLLEGWMLGFKPVGEAAVAAVDKQLVPVDKFLEKYAAAMENMADSWIVIRVDDPQWVFNWRLQAEVEMRATGKPGLTDAQVADFVSRFMPAYKAYLPALYKDGPTGQAGAPRLTLSVNSSRTLVGAQ